MPPLRKKIADLEDENNMLHKRLNRADIVVNGLPDGLSDFMVIIRDIGKIYNLDISTHDINYACYFNNRKSVLYKFNNVFLRDNLMREYFKSRSLKLCDVIGGDINSRLYLNDHYSPAAGRLHTLCRKLLQKKIITKYKVLNADKVKASLTMSDGRIMTCNFSECASFLDNTSVQ